MDDYMDKQTAINLLDNLVGMVEDTQENDYDTALKMGIEALKAQPVQMWIPCSERLPIIENNNRARVLITTSWGFVKEAYYCVDHWEINDIDFILTSVIAWMPLPKPYKDGEQNE